MVYRVTTIGLERLPRGGFLLLPNHITWVDGIILALACPRPIRFMVAQEYYRLPWLQWVLKTTRTIPIISRRSKTAMQAAAEAIRAGEIVCVFPEGELTRSGVLGGLRRGYQHIALRAGAPVVPGNPVAVLTWSCPRYADTVTPHCPKESIEVDQVVVLIDALPVRIANITHDGMLTGNNREIVEIDLMRIIRNPIATKHQRLAGRNLQSVAC